MLVNDFTKSIKNNKERMPNKKLTIQSASPAIVKSKQEPNMNILLKIAVPRHEKKYFQDLLDIISILIWTNPWKVFN